MKVTEGHLNNEQNFFADQLRDRLALERTSFNHGLLPCSPGQTSLEIEINSEWIEVSQCRAITIGGARIEIWPNEAQELRMPIRQLIGSQSVPEHSAWYVVLKVNPLITYLGAWQMPWMPPCVIPIPARSTPWMSLRPTG
jgi:hypothetical protein